MASKSNYDLFKHDGPRVCWLYTTGGKGGHGVKDSDKTSSVNSFGARHIQRELAYNYDIVTIDKISNYDFCLVSLTSVVEIENVLRDIYAYGIDKKGCKIVLGGMGCLNIWPLHHVADIAVFGRAEGQVNGILDGERFDNVWRAEDDPMLEGRYKIRQTQSLLPGESGVGCPKRCSFCQYTHVRRWEKSLTHGYRAGADLIFEDDWNRLSLGPGRNITAWDGWGEQTRRKVKKGVSDADIVNKLVDLRERGLAAAANIKIYQIVGYPWDTPESVQREMTAAAELLRRADGPGTRILIMFAVTPFSPEPITPLEHHNVDFVNWRDVINDWQSPTGRQRQVYDGESIEAFVLPQINGPHTLQRRIALNRCHYGNADIVRRFVCESKGAIANFYDDLDCHPQGQPTYLDRDITGEGGA